MEYDTLGSYRYVDRKIFKMVVILYIINAYILGFINQKIMTKFVFGYDIENIK
jgi:hypothetical protein